MSLLTLLRLNLGRLAAAAVTDSSAGSEAVVAAGLFAGITSTSDMSSETVIAAASAGSSVLDSSSSSDTSTPSGPYAASIVDQSVSGGAVLIPLPAVWNGRSLFPAGPWITPRPAAASSESLSSARVVASVVMAAGITDVSSSEEQLVAYTLSFYAANRAVLMAELDADLVALAS